MPEEQKIFTKEDAKAMSILDVASSLGMELRRNSSTIYEWTEHDSFKIDIRKNKWTWYSHEDKGGDTIGLVQEIKGVTFKEAMHYLKTGEFPTVSIQEEKREPFRYTLAPYEQPFQEARSYLKEQRGLSDETIDFFMSQGVLAQAMKKAQDGYLEPVVVFKFLNQNKKVVGASLQGIPPNKERYEGRGYLKQILYNSDGLHGLSVDIGTPKRLVFAEAPIDLMSYYELNRGILSDVRLVAMDGLKSGTIARHTMQLLAELEGVKDYQFNPQKIDTVLKAFQTTSFFKEEKNQDFITLAVDNDKAGRKFIARLEEKGVSVRADIPPLKEGEEKMDWNDYLKEQNEEKQEEKMELQEKALDQNQEQQSIAGEMTTEEFQPEATFVDDPRIEGEEVERVKAFLQEHKDKFHRTVPYDYSAEHWDTLTFGDDEKDYYIVTTLPIEADHLDYGYPSAEDLYISLTAEDLRIDDRAIEYDEYDDRPELTLAVLEEKFGYRSIRSEKRALEHSQGQTKKIETKLGDFPEKTQEAAPLPEANLSQPLDDLSPNQTRSQSYLHFTINDGDKSIHKDYYHPISDSELVKLNRYAGNIQQTAQWYLDTVADSKIIYFYQEGDVVNSLQVTFDKDKFQHLTGVFPHKEGQTAEQTLVDFAQGQGAFDAILLANKGATFDKLKVLLELPAIVEADSFYFGDLSEVPKLHSLNMNKAIKSGDEDIVLALRTVDDVTFPASLMKLREGLKLQLEHSKQERTVLGVYRERDGVINQLSINEEYVKDKGKAFLEILKNKDFEEVKTQETIVKEELGKARDSDGDGVSDEVERSLGTDPYNVTSSPYHRSKKETDLSKDSSQKTLSDILKEKDTKALSAHLKEGMKEYTKSDQYKNFLTAMSKFHDYSVKNIQLMLAQNRDITHVASYQTWKKEFDRQVQKGEKGLKIFVPVQVKVRDENGEVKKDENGKEMTVTRFKFGTVFDVKQTEGKELPKPIHLLEGSVPDYENLYRATRQVSLDNHVPISFKAIKGDANGYYNLETREIVIAEKQMSEAQIMKTLFHEMAHSRLHHQADGFTTVERELQAESIAYVVASHYGIDTSDYSFAYLHSWSQDQQNYSDLEAQLKVIQSESKRMMEKIDVRLEEVKTKSKFADKLQSKLEKAETETKQAIEQKKVEGKTQMTKKSLTPRKEH
ncbi:PBECR4 domain-containing protein [Streptococcus cuniculi]|uniref:DUF3991 domain-containing protein n=1 Tax=Streptococcus cuniculi TaxID=1432788 RepID=A0A4Y9JAQ9_9STRE|nr:PBECR4 domain-containing protein [Streptococcus cuniculi]MBF0778912.1 toprim domain-containing protein [Streptococcus cuniculi]TFU97186.1 DUF3991 domain-containing protein [Streptococcus cuniculi]